MTEPPPAACHRCRRSAVRDLGRTAQLPQLAIQPALSQQNGSNGGAGTAVPGAVPETSALQPPPHLLGPGHPRPFESFQSLRCRLRPSELHSPAGLGSSRNPAHGRNSWPSTRPGPAPLPPFPPGPPRYRPATAPLRGSPLSETPPFSHRTGTTVRRRAPGSTRGGLHRPEDGPVRPHRTPVPVGPRPSPTRRQSAAPGPHLPSPTAPGPASSAPPPARTRPYR